LKILIVEDETLLVRTLSDLLINRGYTVESRNNGEDALRLLATASFDLVLLDVMLPGIDGFEVCRKLRQTGVLIPVLMLTARGQTRDKVTGLEGGADDYVTKPFDPEELLARIGALLRRAAGGGNELRFFELDGIRIDFARSQIERDGLTLDLSDRESRLLRYFIEHKGEVITREQLLQDVWGYQAVPFTRTVDVHIAWLRQKLETDPKNPRNIVTVHGQGYRFR
jgi:two-component system alkaline phosphatase synthesis response regulator PhoP